jgi:transglutaminase-like putative cysteine protease
MNRFRLNHVTEFIYDGPVRESYNEVRLRPIHDDRQSCLSFRLTSTPSSRPSAHLDYFGNWVHQFNIVAEHRRLRVAAETVVLMHDAPPAACDALTLAAFDRDFRDAMAEDYFDYVTPTEYVPHVAELDALAAEVPETDAVAFLEQASALIHERFEYQKGATHVQSSILDALSIGAGVCQDFAHILLGVARRRGFPARYVSGYMVPESAEEEVIGGQASHAWAEIYVPGCGWLSFDPTLGAPVSLRHVRIAYGRDYGDVAPLRGVYKGHAGQRLGVDVRVRPALDDEGHEQLQESAAGPQEEEGSEAAPQQQQQ